jgi:hypothetical protein
MTDWLLSSIEHFGYWLPVTLWLIVIVWTVLSVWLVRRREKRLDEFERKHYRL